MSNVDVGGEEAHVADTIDRRSLLKVVPAVALGVAAGGAVPAIVTAQQESRQEQEQFEVTPAEDLMREHGLLKRILLVYDEVATRIAGKKDFSPAAVLDSAKIIRSFIEAYHEKLEEEFLFPRFRRHHVLVELVDVL